MAIYDIIITVLWFIMIVVWLTGMFTNKRAARRGWYGWWLRAILVVVILGVVHYDSVNGLHASAISGVITNPALGLLGVILVAVGVALAVWARLSLGRNWGMPMSLREGHQLVESGPYAYMRHPIYSGVLLGMLGSACINWWWGIFFVFFAVYFIYSALREEKDMQAQFPAEYPAYKARTKMLVPFIF